MSLLVKLGSVVGCVTLGMTAYADTSKLKNFDHEYVPGELIVKFQPTVANADREMLLGTVGAKISHTYKTKGAHRLVLESKDAASTEAAAKQIALNANVEYVEANTIIRLENTPDDPRLGDLWGMEKISAEAAWEINTGSADVVVGVIDTGVDHTHPDIAPNYHYNAGEMGTDDEGNDLSTNGIDDDGNGYIDDFRGWDFANDDNNPMDDHDHGTHCAGTIGGAGNNGIGVAGVNWEVGIVGLKFITSQGSGTTADAIEAIEYATLMNYNLTSNSWGGGGFSQTMADAISAANDAGILFVAAAGNSYQNNDRSATYPANYEFDNVISVAASDSRDRKANFSNYGRTTVDLAAPGVNVLSTTRNNRYGSMSGTSMAAPHVAGAVALMMATFPEMESLDIKQKLFDTVDPVSGMSSQVATGGRLNLEAALTE